MVTKDKKSWPKPSVNFFPPNSGFVLQKNEGTQFFCTKEKNEGGSSGGLVRDQTFT